jgi:hypothetical protein
VLRIKRPNKLYCALTIGQNNKLAVDSILFKGLTDQPCVRTIVLDKENRSGFSA